MPSRFVTLMIILFWFFTVGWFVKREFLPSWLASDSSPEFSVDLADEAAPRITSWNIFQGEKKLGYLNSKLSFLGKEDAFEIENRLQSMVVKMGILQYNLEVHIPSIRTVSVIDRNGQLRKQSTSGKFQIYFNIGPQAQDSSQSLSFEAELEGEVREGQFQGQSF